MSGNDEGTGVDRRRLLATGASVAAGLVGGCSGLGDDTGDDPTPRTTERSPTTTSPTTTAGPHELDEPVGGLSVGTKTPRVGERTSQTLTLEILDAGDGEGLSNVTVEYGGGVSVDAVAPEDVTVSRGQESGQVEGIEVTDVERRDGGATLAVTLASGVSLSAGDRLVVGVDGVRLPERRGEYRVDVSVNGRRIDSGSFRIHEAFEAVGSDFSGDIDGWRIEGDAQGGSALPNYLEEGGNPGGHIEAVDDVQGGVWFFVAPDHFLGDRSAFVGGVFAYDIYQDNRSNQFTNRDLVLEGGDRRLLFDYGDPSRHPDTDWTSYAVPLAPDEGTPGTWYRDELDGERATVADFEAVLGDLQRLHVRGEFVSGSDTGYLDNPTLWKPVEGAPDPSIPSVEEGEEGED